MIRRIAALLIFLGLLSGAAHATCSAGSLPFNLTNGTTADASQVMSNYNAIISSVNATCAGSGANSDITSLLGLTTALTAAQGGTNTWVATVASGGSANAQTVTTSLPATSFTLTKGYSVTFLPGFQNSGATTLAVNGTTATAVCMRSNGGGVCNALTGNELNTNIWVTVTYDGTSWEIVSNQFVGGWGMTLGQVGSGNIIAQSTSAPARSCEAPVFEQLQASVSGNNLTVTLLNQNGVTPTSAAPVLICFETFSGGIGSPTWVPVTAATTFTANAGSSFGSANAVAQRYWIIAFNNAGTVNIGVYAATNEAVSIGNGAAGSTVPVNETAGAVSTTACNACTNATTVQTYYSTTALTNVSARIIGYFEATEATAGTWATAPSIVQVFASGMKKPGELVGSKSITTAGNSTLNWTLQSTANPILLSGQCEGSNTSAGAAIGTVLKQGGSVVTATWTQVQPTASALTTAPAGIGQYNPNASGSVAYTTAAANMTTISECLIGLQEIMGALEPANDNEPRVARKVG